MSPIADEIDLTPPDVDDTERLKIWLIENFDRVQRALTAGFTGSIVVGPYTHTFEYGILLTRELTEVFSDEFAAEFR